MKMSYLNLKIGDRFMVGDDQTRTYERLRGGYIALRDGKPWGRKLVVSELNSLVKDGLTGVTLVFPAMHTEAMVAIRAGTAKAKALWVLLSDEHERDGYALRPLRWEGPGEYQHVEFDDGRNGLVKLPFGVSLPTPTKPKQPQTIGAGLTLEEGVKEVQRLVAEYTGTSINEEEATKLIAIGKRVLSIVKGE